MFRTDNTDNRSNVRPDETVSLSSGVVAVGMRHPCQDLRCEHGATCTLGEDGGPLCACLLDCSGAPGPGPICGSDLRLHNNTCAMRLEACRSQHEIRLRPLDLCRGKQHPRLSKEVERVEKTLKENHNCQTLVHENVDVSV